MECAPIHPSLLNKLLFTMMHLITWVEEKIILPIQRFVLLFIVYEED